MSAKSSDLIGLWNEDVAPIRTLSAVTFISYVNIGLLAAVSCTKLHNVTVNK